MKKLCILVSISSPHKESEQKRCISVLSAEEGVGVKSLKVAFESNMRRKANLPKKNFFPNLSEI